MGEKKLASTSLQQLNQCASQTRRRYNSIHPSNNPSESQAQLVSWGLPVSRSFQRIFSSFVNPLLPVPSSATEKNVDGLRPRSHRTRSTLQHARTNYGTHCSKWDCSHRLHQRVCTQICMQICWRILREPGLRTRLVSCLLWLEVFLVYLFRHRKALVWRCACCLQTQCLLQILYGLCAPKTLMKFK